MGDYIWNMFSSKQNRKELYDWIMFKKKYFTGEFRVTITSLKSLPPFLDLDGRHDPVTDNNREYLYSNLRYFLQRTERGIWFSSRKWKFLSIIHDTIFQSRRVIQENGLQTKILDTTLKNFIKLKYLQFP